MWSETLLVKYFDKCLKKVSAVDFIVMNLERTLGVINLFKTYSLHLHQGQDFPRKCFIMGFCSYLINTKMSGKQLWRNFSWKKSYGRFEDLSNFSPSLMLYSIEWCLAFVLHNYWWIPFINTKCFGYHVKFPAYIAMFS